MQRFLRTGVILLILALPLAGGLFAGRKLAEFFQFPPRLEIPTDYLRFSKLAAGAVVVLLAGIALSWLIARRKLATPRIAAMRRTSASERKFPNWGWAALAWMFAWWILAWTRWNWFEPLQQYTFFPLWLGFIVTVNAATEKRAGSCLMRRAPARWLALFAASSACWWVFEWLNRFVRNWHYLHVEGVGALEYFLHATACFSTVLPAVTAVAEWLSSAGRWNEIVTRGPAWGWLSRDSTAFVFAVFGGVSLFATGVWPQLFYPALWVSPLALLLALPVQQGRPSLVHELARGDWSRAATWMIAALVCGFFWELWNSHSFAKWIYTVPGVERWHVFEMPALGYAGYLPFGLECLLLAEWVINDRWRAPNPGSGSPPLRSELATS